MAAVGLAGDGDAGGCRWAAVRHDDNHVHVVATLARADKRPVRLSRDFVRLRTLCRQLEAEFGLTATAGADKTAGRRAGVREHVTAERTDRTEPARETLRRRVLAAAASSGSAAEFSAALRPAEVLIRYRYATDSPGRVVGAAFGLPGHRSAAGNQIWYGGRSLAPDLSWPKLTVRM